MERVVMTGKKRVLTAEQKRKMQEGRRKAKSMDKDLKKSNKWTLEKFKAVLWLPLHKRKSQLPNWEDYPLYPLKAIRWHCLECVGFSVLAVEECTSPQCTLYPYRFGKRPKIRRI